MHLPKEALRFRIENYRDLKELVDFAELIGLPLTEAAAAAIEDGRLRYVTLAEFETYLYMCRYMLYVCRIKAQVPKPSPKLYVPLLGGSAKGRSERYNQKRREKRALLKLQA